MPIEKNVKINLEIGTKGGGAISRIMGGMGSAASSGAHGFVRGASSLATTGSPLAAIGAAFGPIGAIISSALSGISGVVGASNPQAAKEFNRVLSDTAGVMGRMLLPYLQVATKYLRTFADVLARMIPSIEAFSGAQASIWEALQPAFESLADIIGSVVELFASVLTPVIQVLAVGIKYLADGIKNVLGSLGLLRGKSNSFGMGGLDVSWTTGEAYGKSAASSFLQVGRAAAGKTFAERTAEATEKLVSVFESAQVAWNQMAEGIDKMIPNWMR